MALQKIKLIILAILTLLRRVVCCLGRRRKASYSEPMTNVVIEGSPKMLSKLQVNRTDMAKEEMWNFWNDSPVSVQEHIEQYRHRINKLAISEKVVEPDYFKELAPQIKAQPKFHLNENHQEEISFARLEAKTNIPITLNVELEDWDEDEDGWEEMASEEAKRLIREKRQELRNNRLKTSTQPPN